MGSADMRSVDIVNVRISWAEEDPGPPAPHHLRGALGDRFRDNPLFHQHNERGPVYRYPLVQYRWDWRGAAVLGLGEGAKALVHSEWPGMELRIGHRVLHVRDAACEFRRHEITLTDRLIRYRFAAPWLPFNQGLIRHYRALDAGARVRERDRLAVAGLLLGMRGFGVEIQGRVLAAFESQSCRPCPYKGVELIGFQGRLLTNLDLPDGFALGRSTSHGYGWIEREGVDGQGVIPNDGFHSVGRSGPRPSRSPAIAANGDACP
jgi:hypothetical protein